MADEDGIMVSQVFSETGKREDLKGAKVTHWTSENMKFCAFVKGVFRESIELAAKDTMSSSFENYDGGENEYYDATELVENGAVSVTMYGLHYLDGKYYWTGDTKVVRMTLVISVEC